MLDQVRLGTLFSSDERAAGIANVVLAAAQPTASYVTRLTGRGVSEGDRAKLVDGPVSPAPGTFIIWFPLFAKSLAHGAHLARARRLAPPLRKVVWLTSAAYACNAAWSLQAQLRGLGWPSVAIIAGGATSAISALVAAERFAGHSREATLCANAVAPLAGWLTLAAFANLEATLNSTGERPEAPREASRALVLLTAAGATGALVALASRNNPRYTAAIAWGLGGVVVRNFKQRKIKVALAAGLGFGAFLAATLLGRR
jgi:hypothetical protein